MTNRKAVIKRTKNILKYHERYDNMSQENIAKVFKVSQATVSRVRDEYRK